jgi:hypothetical protein
VNVMIQVGAFQCFPNSSFAGLFKRNRRQANHDYRVHYRSGR